MCDVSTARWRLLPFGINVLLVSSAQRVGRVSHKTQGFHFINCRVHRVRESGGKSKLQNTGFPFFINIPEVSRRCDVTPEVETVTYRVHRMLSQQVCVLTNTRCLNERKYGGRGGHRVSRGRRVFGNVPMTYSPIGERYLICRAESTSSLTND